MEFTIDLSMVRKITAEECAQAQAEITRLGVVQAYAGSVLRHDQRLAEAPDASTVACKAGCSWCCHFSVDVRPVEVFAILEFVDKNFPLEEQLRVRKEVAANKEVLVPLDDLERMQQNIKCPFLSAGRCSIYSMRPQTCRNYHATSAAGCQKSYEEPENLDIDPEYAPLLYQAGAAHVDAFSKAMLDEGYDVVAYEMNTALAEAMADSNARRRFEAKQAPFPALEGTDVPMEFLEVDG